MPEGRQFRDADRATYRRSAMHPRTPPDRRAFESPDRRPPEPQNDRTRIEDRTRFASTSTLVTFMLVVAIFLMIILL